VNVPTKNTNPFAEPVSSPECGNSKHMQKKQEAPTTAMVTVRGLYKIYGPKADQARQMVSSGMSASEMRQRGYVLGLSEVSFEVPAGQTYIVMGLSGSGKSTLVRCLNRLIEPTAGTIEIDGRDVTKLDRKSLRRLRATTVSMVFQHFGLLPHRRVLQNVTIGLEVQGLPKSEQEKRAIAALELVGLESWRNFYPRELSGGMQQRVSLARALATDPPLLLLDEPFSGLDPLIRAEMQEELLKLQRQLRKTIIFITHDLDEALLLGDRIGVLHQGKLIEEATPHDLVLRPRTSWVRKFVRRANMLNVLTAREVMIPRHPSCEIAEPRPSVEPELPIRELLRIIRDVGWPIIVRAEDGSVLGQVTRDSFVKQLVEQSQDNSSTVEEHKLTR
jgi:glycine betaine/proline transport system ATP-binding protein